MDKALTLPELLETVPNDARLVLSNEDERGVDIIPVGRLAREAAAELRCLHAENKLLHERHHDDNVEYTRVLEQRDALLEALKLARPYINPNTTYGYHAEVKADAAIKAVEGEQA